MNRKVRYRLGLNESQRALRDSIMNLGEFTVRMVMREIRSVLYLEECWPNNPMSLETPFFTIQKLAEETGISPDTVDKYAHAFIGLTQEEGEYRSKRVTLDHKDAPLILETQFSDLVESDEAMTYGPISGKPFRDIVRLDGGKFSDENGNEILIQDPPPHRILSSRAALFCILAPTKVGHDKPTLRSVRAQITERYSLPFVSNEKVEDAPHKIYERETTEEWRNPALFELLSVEETLRNEEPKMSQQELFPTHIVDPLAHAEREFSRWDHILRRLREFSDVLANSNLSATDQREMLQKFYEAEIKA